jgi:hypothetical protein
MITHQPPNPSFSSCNPTTINVPTNPNYRPPLHTSHQNIVIQLVKTRPNTTHPLSLIPISFACPVAVSVLLVDMVLFEKVGKES